MAIRILIVEDDRDHAESLADILEMRGHQVELANTGEQAFGRFCEADFDLEWYFRSH
jgi:DNA-binding response OmpR family regulator